MAVGALTKLNEDLLAVLMELLTAELNLVEGDGLRVESVSLLSELDSTAVVGAVSETRNGEVNNRGLRHLKGTEKRKIKNKKL